MRWLLALRNGLGLSGDRCMWDTLTVLMSFCNNHTCEHTVGTGHPQSKRFLDVSALVFKHLLFIMLVVNLNIHCKIVLNILNKHIYSCNSVVRPCLFWTVVVFGGLVTSICKLHSSSSHLGGCVCFIHLLLLWHSSSPSRKICMSHVWGGFEVGKNVISFIWKFSLRTLISFSSSIRCSVNFFCLVSEMFTQ